MVIPHPIYLCPYLTDFKRGIYKRRALAPCDFFKNRLSFGSRLHCQASVKKSILLFDISLKLFINPPYPYLGLLVAHIAIICKITKTTTPLIVGLGQRPTSGHSRCIFCLIFNYYVMHFLNWQWPVLFYETRTKNGLRFTDDQVQ